MKSTFPFLKKLRVIWLKAKLTSLCACSSEIFSTAVCFDCSASFFSVERLSCQQKKCLLIQQYYIKRYQFKVTFFFSQNTAASTRVRTWGIPKEIALSLIEAFYRINHMCDVSERSAPILRSFELLLGRCRILLDNVRSGFNELQRLGRIQHHLTMLDVVWQTCWRWIRSKLDCMKQSLLDKVN